MSDLRVAPLIGLGAVTLVCGTAAVVLLLVASGWQLEANEIWNSVDPNSSPFTDNDYDRANVLSTNAYTLTTLMTPLLLGGIVAVLAIPAVLAWRWERRLTPQATAAS
jgi:hypothetical protein